MIKNRTLIFSIVTGIIVLATIIVGRGQVEEFERIHLERFNNVDQHGRERVSYPSQFSLMTNSLLLLTNFLLFFVYFQLSMSGAMNLIFFFVMILHFCHSFCFQGHIYILHIKIMAYDKHADPDD